MPSHYSTVSGHLTPTQARHEDMRMDSMLNVTPEGSLSDLPVVVGDTEDSGREQKTQQAPENKIGGVCPSTTVVTLTEEIPNTFVKTVPGRDSNEQGFNQVEPPRRILRTREASQEDTLASTRHFCATVNEQNQVITFELPEEVPTVAAEGDTTINPIVPITSTTTTITETETRGPRTFLPNGSPSNPQ